MPFSFGKERQNPLRMGPKNPLSLQNLLKIKKPSPKEKLWKYRITLSEGKTIEKTLKNGLINGQQSNE